jgi:hypothetical protein
MSYKTDRLAKLFPQAYATTDTESLLYQLLDAIGAELMNADAAVKQLLKAHWVNYASDAGLDGLGALYGVSRRALPNGELEPDDVFRARLKSTVQLYTGGGTIKAIKGAVRSGLGLPYDLDHANLPNGLRQDLENLIDLKEFSPDIQRSLSDSVTTVGNASQLILSIDIPSVRQQRPTITWEFTSGAGRELSLELLGAGAGLKSDETLLIPNGQTLTLTADATGNLIALLDSQNITARFTNLDGSQPARLPDVPTAHSDWKFRARSGLFDIGQFDTDTFDVPKFRVEMRWERYQPLTIDVYVPYFLDAAVQALTARHGYTRELFVFQGLPREAIAQIVDQTRAAGVQANVHFSLNFNENHAQSESFQIDGWHHVAEDAAASDALAVGSIDRSAETHDVEEAFAIGGVFDISTFDGIYGFV